MYSLVTRQRTFRKRPLLSVDILLSTYISLTLSNHQLLILTLLRHWSQGMFLVGPAVVRSSEGVEGLEPGEGNRTTAG